jgi:hypothetical protein
VVRGTPTNYGKPFAGISKQRYKNPERQVTGHTLAPNIGGSSAWSLVHAAIPAPRILMWFPDFSKTCELPLSAAIQLTFVLSHGHNSQLLVVLAQQQNQQTSVRVCDTRKLKFPQTCLDSVFTLRFLFCVNRNA